MSTETDKIEDLKKSIETMEKELAEAKKLADEAVKEEMKALGYTSTASHFNWYWRDLT